MKFNSPQEVLDWANEQAPEDFRSAANGWDINPYSTAGARDEWQRGFDNAPLLIHQGVPEWNWMYQRGRAMARLLTEIKEAG